MNPELVIGDIVKFITGEGPVMVVVTLDSIYTGNFTGKSDIVICQYWDEVQYKFNDVEIPVSALRKSVV